MASDPHYVFLRVPAPASVWTAIIVPVDCNCFSLKSSAGQNLRIRTDQADANTEDLLPGGSQEGLISSPETVPNSSTMRYRASANPTPCYVQPQPASPDVVVAKFVR
jgi:hypothetical protein